MRSLVVILAAAGAAAAAAQSCAATGSARQDCYPWWYLYPEQMVTPSAEVCHAQGCCWDPEAGTHDAACFYPAYPAPAAEQCEAVDATRLDCFPETGSTESACAARGCCWDASASGMNGVPYCFYPKNYAAGYSVTSTTNTAAGITASLTLPPATRTPYGNAVKEVQLDVWEETSSRLHFKLTDPSSPRWEPPVETPAPPAAAPASTDYVYKVKQAPFSIEISRKSTGSTLFNSTVPTNGPKFGTLTYTNQFLEISSSLPANPNIYGLGEHITPLKLDTSGESGQIYTLLARDQGTPVHRTLGGSNIYASQPIYMILDPVDGTAHGVFLLNSNAMDISLYNEDGGAFVTYRVLGGVLDFYVFSGPTPEDVVQQYLNVIGKPFLPPYWSLGFHLCRWGYMNLTHTQQVNDAMRTAGIPQDVQWNDIDYMDQHLDFTSGPDTFPISEYGHWVNVTLPSHGQHYIPIFDPAISSAQPAGTYPAYDDGLAQDVFLKNSTGGVFIGLVWPGPTAFPDFFSENATNYWTRQFTLWHDKVPFDSAWIDMNEPSNFCNGQCRMSDLEALEGPEDILAMRDAPIVAAVQAHPTPAPAAPAGALRGAAASPAMGSGFDPIFPPFLPGREGGAVLIDTKTVSMDVQQVPSIHYNVHNMYGWSETKATMAALQEIRGERSIVISRSTFPSSGVHGGHWLGDNTASWDDLYYSIPGVLSMQLYGIPFVGADVCGFGGSTTPELCTRWQQLGAFYPFYRNHNTIRENPQAPYVFGDPYTSAIREAILLRYSLLPHLYTLLNAAHTVGGTVARPLFFEWPTGDSSVIPTLDKQFLWGSSLLVSPVLTQGANSVSAYFPDAPSASDQQGWFDWFTGARLHVANAFATLDAPLSVINLHLRGGAVIPTQDPAMTTTFAVDNAFHLTVALAANTGAATGALTVDDGVSLDSVSAGKQLEIAYSAAGSSTGGHPSGSITSKVSMAGYTPPANATLWSARVLNVCGYPETGGAVFCNQAPATYLVDTAACVLTVQCAAPVSVPAQDAGLYLEEPAEAHVAPDDTVEVIKGLDMTQPISIVWK